MYMINHEQVSAYSKSWNLKDMAKVLYVRNVDTTWTRRDKDILSTQHSVDDLYIKDRFSALVHAFPLNLLKYDTVFCWFGSLNFLPILLVSKLLRKQIIIVAGGFDVANVPSISYGGFHRGKLSMILRKLVFKLSDKVLSVSRANTNEAITNADIPADKIQLIYHGFTPLVKEVTPFAQRKNQVISVGAINPETMKRKGHYRFVELAKESPDIDFILAGKYALECKEEIEGFNVPNLKMPGFLTIDELNNLLNESKYYIQLSEHEAFGCSVVEAGICGCQIIASNRAALPEVSEGVGAIFDPDDIQSIKSYLEANISNSQIEPQKVSENFLKRFPFESRKEDLLKQIQ